MQNKSLFITGFLTGLFAYWLIDSSVISIQFNTNALPFAETPTKSARAV